jgi:type I restriction enzyme S subunit
MSDDATLDEFVEAESDFSEPETEDLARKTVCGIPPQDWTVARLGELVRVVSGNSLPTEYQNGKEGEYPVYKVSDMNATGNQKYVSDTSNRLSNSDLEEINHTLYPEGTTILPKVGAALLTNKRRMLTEPSSFDNNVMGWVPDEINPEFLYYVSCMIDMEAVAQKGAVPSISKAIAKSLKLPSPPLSEQRKIATVLYTVDRAIEKTEEIIEQLHDVRDSLLREIFTLGIDDEGCLRSPEECADDFKKTPLGRIPKSWECVTLGRVIDRSGGFIQTGPFGSQLHKEEYVAEGVPVVMPQNIEESKIIKDEIAEITQEKADDLARHKMEPNDVVIARRGNLERAASISEREEGWLCGTGCLLIRPSETEINGEWLRMAYQHPQSQHQINSRAVGSTMSNLNQSILESLQISLPPISEQERITEKILNIDRKIDYEARYSESLKHLRRGLMQDLLTGTVRTTDTNIQVPDEIAQHG